VSLRTPEKLRELQRKLYRKAKQEPTYRFYSLYDKVYRPDILVHAYALVRDNGGAPGVDGRTFADIEEYGERRFLADLGRELREGTYRPDAVRRVMIPKPDGGERPLGIPTVRDRTVQAAAKLVLEPIFEADFTANAYGYRPGKSGLDAVKEVHRTLKAGYTQVVDADVSKFFDSIPHSDLLRSVARRVADGRMLRLVKLWLKAPVEETGEKGRSRRRGSGNRGTPQGGVLSPLLANIYMRRFLKAWEERGAERKLKARIVNYADDFVILCRSTPERALSVARHILARMGLELNETKTRTCDAWREPFDFLGYTFGRQHYFGSGNAYLGASPSRRSVARLKGAVRKYTHLTFWSEDEVVRTVNTRVRGWIAYFSYGSLWRPYVKLEHFLQARIRRWLVRKHKLGSRGECRYPAGYVYDRMGLIHLPSVLKGLRTPC
jgi:RNA-directed DNA polymerase